MVFEPVIINQMNNLKTAIMKKMTKKRSVMAVAIFAITVIITDFVISQLIDDWFESLLTSFVIVISLAWTAHVIYFLVSTAIRLNHEKSKIIPRYNDGKVQQLINCSYFPKLLFMGISGFIILVIVIKVVEIFSVELEEISGGILTIWSTIVGIWSYIWPYIEPGAIPVIVGAFAWFVLRAAAYEGAMMAIRDSKSLDEDDEEIDD